MRACGMQARTGEGGRVEVAAAELCAPDLRREENKDGNEDSGPARFRRCLRPLVHELIWFLSLSSFTSLPHHQVLI